MANIETRKIDWTGGVRVKDGTLDLRNVVMALGLKDGDEVSIALRVVREDE